jgi:hypothetical protein
MVTYSRKTKRWFTADLGKLAGLSLSQFLHFALIWLTHFLPALPQHVGKINDRLTLHCEA